MKRHRAIHGICAVVAVAAAMTMPASAAQQSVNGARVTLIEPTYMPGFIAFKIDKAAGACAAGTYLKWYGLGADAEDRRNNVRAIHAELLTALAGNRPINLGVNDADCTVTVFMLM